MFGQRLPLALFVALFLLHTIMFMFDQRFPALGLFHLFNFLSSYLHCCFRCFFLKIVRSGKQIIVFFRSNAVSILHTVDYIGVSFCFLTVLDFLCVSFSVPYELSLEGMNEPWVETFLSRIRARQERCNQIWISLQMEVTACYPQAIALQ